jgi:hypothetical protein
LRRGYQGAAAGYPCAGGYFFEPRFQNVGDQKRQVHGAGLWPHPTGSFQHRHQGEFTLAGSKSDRGTADRIGRAANPAEDAHANRRLRDRKERQGLGNSLARRLHSDLRAQEGRRSFSSNGRAGDHEHAAAVTLLLAEALPQDGSSDK